MNVFIDNQYQTIYDGEFKKWVEETIIKPLQSSCVLTIPKSREETQKLLTVNKYDIIIITGYSYEILTMIDSKSECKIISIIYDMNAEKMLELQPDNSFLADVVAFKSRLIFLSNRIIPYNSLVKDEIIYLYKEYKKHNIDIESKIRDIDFYYNLNDSFIKKKVIDGKYLLIPESVNGITFVSEDFVKLINNITSINLPDSLKIVIVGNNFPDKIWYNIKNKSLSHKFKILKDVNEEELKSLYKYSFITILSSPIDNNLYNLCDIISLNVDCLINYKNISFTNFLGDSGNYYDPEDNTLIQNIVDFMRESTDIKKKIRKEQLDIIKQHSINPINPRQIIGDL